MRLYLSNNFNLFLKLCHKYTYFVIQNCNGLYHIKRYLVSFLVCLFVCLFVTHQFLNGVSYNDTSDGNMRVLSCDVRGSAQSLARPGSRQTTATKLGIYSTYSQRSSIHFLARCSNFCKSLKKIQKFVRPTRSPRQQWPPSRKKNCDFSIVFSVQGTGGSPTGPDPENRVSDQETGSPGRPVYSGLQVPGEPGHCRARTRSPWWPLLHSELFGAGWAVMPPLHWLLCCLRVIVI